MRAGSCRPPPACGRARGGTGLPALGNDLAPDHLRGRYNALLVLGSLGVGLMAVGHVERRLPPGVNGVREDDLVSVV